MRKKMKMTPHFRYEEEHWKQGKLVIGIDEVGRGALAGPVYVAAVCFQPQNVSKLMTLCKALGINDSKKVSKEKRKKLEGKIKKIVRSYIITYRPVEVINRVGIVTAVRQAMREAIVSLVKKCNAHDKCFVLVDGFKIPYLRGVGYKNQLAIVKGDSISFSIAVASILAKVERDRVMTMLSRKYKGYYWKINKGYGTKRHLDAIRRLGITAEHRTLFVRKILSKKKAPAAEMDTT
jgi:ribonuclease HII